MIVGRYGEIWKYTEGYGEIRMYEDKSYIEWVHCTLVLVSYIEITLFVDLTPVCHRLMVSSVIFGQHDLVICSQ